MIRVLLLAALLLGCVACQTQPLVEMSTPVPVGMTAPDIEQALLLAVQQRKDGPTPGERISDDGLAHIFGSDPDRGWFFEGRADPGVFVGYKNRTLYLHVRVTFDESNVFTNIVSSQELRQSETRIHKRALQLQHFLMNRIRKSLGVVAERDMRSSVPPKTSAPSDTERAIDL